LVPELRVDAVLAQVLDIDRNLGEVLEREEFDDEDIRRCVGIIRIGCG
jgi:hypothetical protein